MPQTPVSVTLQQLTEGLSPSTLQDAFGPESLGIIIVTDIDPRFHALREKVLRGIFTLAHLPSAQLAPLELPESMWLTGWSRGKEILSSNGLPDFNKGSFYVNCAFHQDSTLEGPEQEMVESFADYKGYTTANVWPENLVLGLETFKRDTKELCSLIIEVAEMVARNCDKMLSTIDPDRTYAMEKMIRTSTCSKARLLHYYSTDGTKAVDDWCGEHVDHSCITGLVSALYRDEQTETTLDRCPDENAGLFIRDRNDTITKVDIPAECLAFQTGSALEEMSRGKFKSVPHLVRGTTTAGVARNTLAVFCQPNLQEMVNDTENFAEFAKRIVASHH